MNEKQENNAPCTPQEFPFLDLRSPDPVDYKGRTYPSAENAWQSTRFKDPKMIEKFRYMTPQNAAYRGASWRTTVPGWDMMSRDFLYDVLFAKFSHKDMRENLLRTGSRPILIANYRHENSLGSCQCPLCKNKGANALGKLLEQVRDAVS